MLFRSMIVSLVVLTGSISPANAESKPRIRPTGVRAVVGMVSADDADTGVLLGGALNLGTIWKPWVHLSAGATRWSTDLDASAFDDRNGTLSDLRLYSNVGLELPEVSGVQPYVDVGIGSHFLDATIPNDESLANAISGTNFGGEAAFGLGSTAGAFRISAEARREWVDDANNWSFVIGIGSRWDKKRKNPPENDEERHSTRTVPVEVKPLVSTSDDRTQALERENETLRRERDEATRRSLELEQLLARNQELRSQLESLSQSFQQFKESATRSELQRLEEDRNRLRQELATARLESLRDTQLTETAHGLLLSIRSSVLFASGESTLAPGGEVELVRVADVVRRFPQAQVVVEGHTDDDGSAADNVLLSQRRADTVRAQLVRAGLHSSSVTAVGFGEDQPVASNDTSDGRARNRRVDIRLIPTSASSQSR